MKRLFSLVCIVSFLFCTAAQVFAYTPSDAALAKAERLSKLYSTRILRQPQESQQAYREKLIKKFNRLQKKYARSSHPAREDRIFLYEYLRRHLVGYTAPSDVGLIDDPHFTWTRASDGFAVIYAPYDTPSLLDTDPDHHYRALVNGSYFSRFEEGSIHSGFLAFGGDLYTTFVGDDPQLTHTICFRSDGSIDFIGNADFTNDLVQRCDPGFQAGPLVYSEKNGTTLLKNTAPGRYIGLSHERTVMVIFTKGISGSAPNSQSSLTSPGQGDMVPKQELWFLTISKKVTLQEVIDIVLLESRFRGEYSGVDIFNLDGGSSVGYVNHTFPSINFGKSKKLPVVFGIK